MEELSPELDNKPLLSNRAKDIISATAITTTGALLLSPLAIPTVIVMVKHHIAISLLSILYHRKDVHSALELNPIFEKVADTIITGHTLIDRATWVSSHKQHHLYSDKSHTAESLKLQDPHPPKVLGERGIKRLLIQWLKPSAKKYYTQTADWLEENTIHRDNKTIPDSHIPSSDVDLRGRRSLGKRLIPGVIEYSVYLSLFGPESVAYMLALQALLGSGGITAVNGGGHSSTHENNQGNHAQNITRDDNTLGAKIWNAEMTYLTGGESLHGNHHENMRSADISLGDPNKIDTSYWYIKNILEPLGLAWDVKDSTQKNKKEPI